MRKAVVVLLLCAAASMVVPLAGLGQAPDGADPAAQAKDEEIAKLKKYIEQLEDQLNKAMQAAQMQSAEAQSQSFKAQDAAAIAAAMKNAQQFISAGRMSKAMKKAQVSGEGGPDAEAAPAKANQRSDFIKQAAALLKEVQSQRQRDAEGAKIVGRLVHELRETGRVEEAEKMLQQAREHGIHVPEPGQNQGAMMMGAMSGMGGMAGMAEMTSSAGMGPGPGSMPGGRGMGSMAGGAGGRHPGGGSGMMPRGMNAGEMGMMSGTANMGGSGRMAGEMMGMGMPSHGADDIHRVVGELREQVEQLRAEVRDLNRFVRRGERGERDSSWPREYRGDGDRQDRDSGFGDPGMRQRDPGFGVRGPGMRDGERGGDDRRNLGDRDRSRPLSRQDRDRDRRGDGGSDDDRRDPGPRDGGRRDADPQQGAGRDRDPSDLDPAIGATGALLPPDTLVPERVADEADPVVETTDAVPVETGALTGEADQPGQ